jgi:hypothetical protein
MTYKYLLGLLKAEAYDAFFEAMNDGFTCFMDPLIYGRSPLENSSFIATTNNPDLSKHGQGFFARLSGSTAEVISMWKRMIFGPSLFSLKDGNLAFQIKPFLTKDFFINGKIESRLFSDIQVTILYLGHLPTFDSRIQVAYYEVKVKSIDQIQRVDGPVIQGDLAQQIRDKLVTEIRVFLEGGTP